MRELKFRVWDNGQNRYVLRVISMHYDMVGKLHSIDVEDITHSSIQLLSKKIIIEQFTGLKDKNGKEIYEGDLIKCYTQEGYPVGKVIYSETWTEYEIVGYDQETKREYSLEHFGLATNGYLEVIGNVHENQDLLGGEK